MKISIIIPTYNEEEYLPNLLRSIKSQNFKDYEIIVADANSKDRTVEIANEYKCRVVEGGLPGIGRNNGAKVATGNILLFLDSDLELTDGYLKDLSEEFEKENLDVGITQMTPISEKTRDKFIHNLANWFMIAFENIKPHGAGCYGIIAKKEIHEKYNGFDENLNFGEDTDYIERLAKNNTFKVLRNPKLFVSTRRLEEEGFAKLAKQYGKSTLNDFRGRRTDANELRYEFGHGHKDPVETEELLEKIEKLSILNTTELTTKPKDAIENKPSKMIESYKEVVNKQKSNINTIQNSKIPSKQKSVKTRQPNLKPKEDEKKRIFYSVCGEGLGHAVRSGVILEELTKKYDIYIFSSDRAYKYLNDKFDNVFEIGGFNTVYENNEVQNKKTLYNAIKSTPNNLKENYGILFKRAREIKPNIIISDFENFASILSKIINVPLLSIDNIHIITQTKVDYPPNHRKEMLKAKGVIKSYIFRPKRYILTNFFYPEIKDPNKTVIYPPVIRDKIRNLKVSYGDYILVYQTSASSIKLIETLKEVNEDFIVYGFNKDEVDCNLTFRKFNEDKIYKDMQNAKAVLTNGGFTLISEAICLKKPIYSIPANGNFEQLLNGFYVDKLGYGEMHKDLNVPTLENFLENLEKYQKTLSKIKKTENKGIIEELEKSIELFSLKRSL